MKIATNSTAFNIWTNYTKNNAKLQTAMSKLSSGYISNTDDPAGIGISERMKAQEKSTEMASSNAENAVSLLQTADSWLQTVNDELSRMKALAVEDVGVTSDSDKQNIQTEFKSLQQEITRITSKYTAAAKFNGLYLFRGGNGVAIVTGDKVDSAGVAGYTGGAKYTDADFASNTTFHYYMNNPSGSFDTFLRNKLGTNTYAAGYADSFNNLLATDTSLTTAFITDASFSISDLDSRSQELYAEGVSNLSSDDLYYLQRHMVAPYNYHLPAYTATWSDGTGTSKGITVQVGSDVDQTISIKLSDLQVTNTATIGTVSTYSYGTDGTSIIGSSHTNVSWGSIIDTHKLSVGSANAIAMLEAAINYVSNTRASVGAQQSRFEGTYDGLITYADNLSSAESSIRDVDMARETTLLSTYQVLTSAATSVLAQANSMSSSITTLLQG